MSDRLDRVRSFFAEPGHYLSSRGDFNIRLRSEVVQGLVEDAPPATILDIGCGSGAISLPLLTATNHLTLVDLSAPMLEIARGNIPAGRAAQVTLHHGDVMAVDLAPASFDLVLGIGVLAHVESPPAFIERMVSLMRPGGRIIVQNTDAAHPTSRVLAAYAGLARRRLAQPYRLNELASAAVIEAFAGHGLRLTGEYRYALPLPGMTRVVSGQTVYRAIRALHGTHEHNGWAWLGAEGIFEFRR